MAEADQIDARSRTATRPSLQRVAALALALKQRLSRQCVWRSWLKRNPWPSGGRNCISRGPPASSRGWRSRFETLTHADLVYEVNVDPDGHRRARERNKPAADVTGELPPAANDAIALFGAPRPLIVRASTVKSAVGFVSLAGCLRGE